MASPSTTIIQWIVDTRELWPTAAKTKDLEDAAPDALGILTEEEKAGVLRYYFLRDAKMALASHLLKHFVISKYCGIPWVETKLTRDANKKPIFKDASGNQPISFNVTHQAGVVAMAAVHGYEGQVDVGVDIVCVSERRDRDHQVIEKDGWAAFVNMHADVFGKSEVAYLHGHFMATQPNLPPLVTLEDIKDFKLRCFYTLWCLREAYIKMTGEALLAPWLQDLDFKRFAAPSPGSAFEQRDNDDESQVVTDYEIQLHGQAIDNANVCLRALGPDYMTCTAVRTPHKKEDGLAMRLGPYEIVTVDEIVEFVRCQGAN